MTRVSVWVGALSHMSAEHFREHFSHAAAGTIAEAADLSVQVSTELDDPNAQSLLLQSVEIDM